MLLAVDCLSAVSQSVMWEAIGPSALGAGDGVCVQISVWKNEKAVSLAVPFASGLCCVKVGSGWSD